MFKSTRRKIEKFVSERMDYHNLYYHEKMEKYVCETCGCLIAPQFAVAGEKEIRQGRKYVRGGGYYLEDCIYTPYFCKTHAPKVKK